MKTQGFSNALKYGLLWQSLLEKLKRLGIEIVLYYLVIEGDFSPDPAWATQFEEFELSLLSDQDMQELVPTRAWISEESLRERLSAGQLCIGLRDRGRLAAYTWADLRFCNHQPNRFELAPGEVYLYEAYTMPAYRGRDLAPFMRLQCYALLRERGCTVFYSITDYFNAPALRFKQKLDARLASLYLYLRIGRNWRRNWTLRTCVPRDPI